MSQDVKPIDLYEKQVGIRRFSAFKFFEKYARRRYGKQKVGDVLDAIARRGRGEAVNVYPLLYESLDLSLDLLIFQAELHRSYLRWFIKRDIQAPSRLLDLGCGNGYLTCFYAKSFPGCEIIGIDKSPQAIECATELSRRLRLDNVRFEVGDIADLRTTQLPGEFDLITAVPAFRDVIDIPDSRHVRTPVGSLLESYKESANVEPLRQIIKLLRMEDGYFISLERWGSLPSYGWWAFAHLNAGLSLDFEHSSETFGKSFEGDETQKYPILLSRRDSASLEVSVDEVIAFWLRRDFLTSFDQLRVFNLQGDVAESVLSSVNPKRLQYGVKAALDEEHVLRIELWIAGPFLLVFHVDPHGARLLEALPSIV